MAISDAWRVRRLGGMQWAAVGWTAASSESTFVLQDKYMFGPYLKVAFGYLYRYGYELEIVTQVASACYRCQFCLTRSKWLRGKLERIDWRERILSFQTGLES